MNRIDDKSCVLAQHGCFHSKPRSVSDPLFQNSDFFDPRDLLQVRYEMVRCVRREQVSVAEATRRFGFSRPVFYQAQQRFTEQGLIGLIPRPRGPHSSHKLTETVIDFLVQRQAEQADLQANELANEVQQRFGISVHPRSVERALSFRRQKRGKGRRSQSNGSLSRTLDSAIRESASTGLPRPEWEKPNGVGTRLARAMWIARLDESLASNFGPEPFRSSAS